MTTASVFEVEVLAGVLLRAQQEGREPNEWEATGLRPMFWRSADQPTEVARNAEHLGRDPRFDERINWSAVLHQGGDPRSTEVWIRDGG